MEPLAVFSVRDLRNGSGGPLKNAEQEQLAIITKRGRRWIIQRRSCCTKSCA